MMLADVIDAYLTRQQSLGMRFDSAGQLLHRFGRAMGDRPIEEVTPGAILDFLNGNRALTATWMLKHRVLTGLYRFAVSRGYVDNSPLPTTLPKLPPQQTPYVYSADERRRLLEATAILRTGHSRQVPAMYCTLLLLLYGTGMRIGEALRLTLQDVDLAERIITVRCTKFFKTRLVPIGPKLAVELAAHLERRGLLPMQLGKAVPLFASRGIRGWSYPRVIAMFQHVRRAAGINCPVGEPRPPRLHDLRHTAAVHRVVAWYRTGQDVQRLLPQLATYLGHLDIRSTQRYLRMTPELLQAASQRFAQYAMGGDHEG
jgi:integrase/recombinase XerD